MDAKARNRGNGGLRRVAAEEGGRVGRSVILSDYDATITRAATELRLRSTTVYKAHGSVGS